MEMVTKKSVTIFLSGFVLSGIIHSVAVVLVFKRHGCGMCSVLGSLENSANPVLASDAVATGEFAALTYNKVDESNPLWTYFQSYTDGPVIEKWLPYLSVYHRFFSPFRGKPVRFLEIGVQSGGTIKFWQHYFGHHLDYHGVDINFLCKEIFGGMTNVTISTGDQSNATFWAEYLAGQEPFDIVVDDGGHSMNQQITTFKAVYSHVAKGGIYIVEDMATSYDKAHPSRTENNTYSWGGGYGKSTTWSEYAKAQVDHLNGHYIAKDGFPSAVTKNTLGVSFFDQMVVFEVGTHPKAAVQKHGTFSLPYIGNADKQDPAELARMKKAVEPFL